MGYDNESSLKGFQIFFKPLNRLRIEVVRRFVQEQYIRLSQKEPANRNAATLTARKNLDRLIGRRAVHRCHRALDERIDIPIIVSVDLILESRHLRFGLGIVEIAAELFVAIELSLNRSDSLLNYFADGLGIIKLRLLREIADLRTFSNLNRAHQIRVEASENLEKRRLARAVSADDADMRTVEERKINVLQNRFRTRLLGYINETELIFTCHNILPF